MQPAALEAARRASVDDASARDQELVALDLQLQQARYQAQRAERQYDAVDPDNRAVALARAPMERRASPRAIDSDRIAEIRCCSRSCRTARPRAVHGARAGHGARVECKHDRHGAEEAPRPCRDRADSFHVDVARSEIVLTVHWGRAHRAARPEATKRRPSREDVLGRR